MVYPRHAVTCVGGSLYALAARQFASSGGANLNIRKTVYGPYPGNGLYVHSSGAGKPGSLKQTRRITCCVGLLLFSSSL